MTKIVVIGDFNIDLVLYLDRFPQPGETLNGNDFLEGPGGKGSNQAIAAARLGAEVQFVGAIGDDHFGQAALDAWRENGVQTDALMVDETADTAVAMIYVDAKGDNMIAVYQGANLLLTPETIDTTVESVIAQADVLMCTLGVPLNAVQRGLEIAKANDTLTLLNPAPAVRLSDAMLDAADYLTPNETELATITGAAGDGDLVERARRLLRRDDQTFVLTLGGEGARWVSREDDGHVPVFDVEVVDTVGAGDAFNAGLAVALAEGQALPEAIRFANAAAGLSVTEIGAVAGMPHRQAVDDFLREQGSAAD